VPVASLELTTAQQPAHFLCCVSFGHTWLQLIDSHPFVCHSTQYVVWLGKAVHLSSTELCLQENVDMMTEYIPLQCFKAIYVVDLCHSLCEQAKKKAAAKGWTNVHVVEADACTWAPPVGRASLVTFSYSLSSKQLAAYRSFGYNASITVAPGQIATWYPALIAPLSSWLSVT
jgi:hypothetical protein